jgi:uncharacterized protein YkwD
MTGNAAAVGGFMMRGMQIPRSAPGRVAVLTLLLGLAACGGGGSDSDSSSDDAAPASPLVATPEPAPATDVAGNRATCQIANFREQALVRMNAYRAAGATCGSTSFPAAPALVWSDSLTQAALVHSDDMVARNFFSHTGSDGSNPSQRANAAGYSWPAGENLSAGRSGINEVMAAWMASPGHCANFMNALHRDVGLACVSGTASNTYQTYWTMLLGASR